jgi:tetratricopeptide (TPR) repeat protein
MNQIYRDDVLDYLAKAESDAPKDAVITGAATSGKSSLLRELESQLQKMAGYYPIRLSPPPNYLDSGQSAMLELSSKLKKVFPTETSDLDKILNPEVNWKDKTKLLHSNLQSLNKEGKRIVLLLDEPENWTTRGWQDSSLNENTEFFLQMLKGVQFSKVISGVKSQSWFTPVSKEFKLLEHTGEDSWVLGNEDWGSLQEVAKELWEALGRDLKDRSKLKCRMLLGIAWAKGVPWVAANFQNFKVLRDYTSTFVYAIRDKSKEVLDLSYKLTFPRREISKELIKTLSTNELSTNEFDVLTKCLMFPLENSFILHENLRHDIQTLVDPQKKNANESHRKLARFYSEKIVTSALEVGPLQNYMEAYYHSIIGCDFDWYKEHQLIFTEQLNTIGHRLSTVQQNYLGAIEAFETAMKWDNLNDYAHHYFAYNKDILAEDREEVEEHYQFALSLDPSKIRWHSHYIDFLISTGRFKDAENAWNFAIESLCQGDEFTDQNLYENLHEKVALRLVYAGRAGEAKNKISSIPHSLKTPKALELEKIIAALEESEVKGAFVPYKLQISSRWKKEPFLLPSNRRGNWKLDQWFNGKIESVDESVEAKVIRFLAEGKNSQKHGTVHRLVMEKEKFFNICEESKKNKKKINTGTYFEYGLYTNGARKMPVIRIIEKDDYQLPEGFPPPYRYLKS